MQNFRSLFLAASTLLSLVLIAFSVTLAIGGILTAVLFARMVSYRMKPVPVKAKSRQNLRVWNDGRGTIIDL